MKALIQRVGKANVSVNGKSVGTIGKGLLIFIGIYYNDSIDDIYKICKKIINLRIFNDSNKKLNKSVLDIRGEILLVSQFTLCAETKKGNRPSFVNAMEPNEAKKLFNKLFDALIISGVKVFKGKFRSMMDVKLNNIGPMTIILDTNNAK